MQSALYVTPKKGATVPRFGAPRGTYIGAKRVGKQLAWDEVRIVAIPADEYKRYRAEYDGAIADGSLTVRNAADYAKQVEERKAKNKKAAEDAAKKAAEAAPADTAPADTASADTAPTEPQRIRAIAETAATLAAPADAERPKPLLLDGKDKR